MDKNYIALHFVTAMDTEKLEREKNRLVSVGFNEDEACAALGDITNKYSIPPISLQRIVGMYAITCRQKGDEEPVIRSFAIAGDNEGAIVNFTFRALDDMKPTKKNPPTVFAGNGGFSLSLLLSKTNERTLAERTETVLRKGDNDFFGAPYGGILSLLLDNSDKFGVNYTNKFSKVVFNPGEFDSLPGIPSYVPSERMFREKDWEGILNLARASCEDLFLRSVNIIDNRNGVVTPKDPEKGTRTGEGVYPALPDPGVNCLFKTIMNKGHKSLTWKEIQKNLSAPDDKITLAEAEMVL